MYPDSLLVDLETISRDDSISWRAASAQTFKARSSSLDDLLPSDEYKTVREVLCYLDFPTSTWPAFLATSLPARTLSFLHLMDIKADKEIKTLQSWCDAGIEEIDSTRNVAKYSKALEALHVWYKEGSFEMVRSFMTESTLSPLCEVLIEMNDFIPVEELCGYIYDIFAITSFDPILEDTLPEELDALKRTQVENKDDEKNQDEEEDREESEDGDDDDEEEIQPAPLRRPVSKDMTEKIGDKEYKKNRNELGYLDFISKEWPIFFTSSLPLRTIFVLHSMVITADKELLFLQSWCDTALEELSTQRDAASSSSSNTAQYVWYKQGDLEMLRSLMIESTVNPLREVLLEMGNLITDEDFYVHIHDMVAMNSVEPLLRQVVQDEL
eukprot:IDg3527t1